MVTPVDGKLGRSQLPSAFFHRGTKFEIGQRFERVRFSRNHSGQMVMLPKDLPGILPDQEADHLKDGQLVSVVLTSYRFGGGFYRVTCRLAEPPASQPAAAAQTTDPLKAVLLELTAKTEQANTAQALVDLTGHLRRAATRFSPIKVKPATDQWVAKATEMISFYLEAKSALGWTRAAVTQYEDMGRLLAQLRSFPPPTDQAGPKKLEMPSPYKGQLSDLSRVASWTQADIAQHQERIAAERAAQLISHNRFRGKSLDALIINCRKLPEKSEEKAQLAVWLRHITRDNGETFLQEYPNLDDCSIRQPGLIREYLGYLKLVITSLE